MEGVPLEMMYGLEDPVDRQDYAGFRILREKLKIPLFVHISLPYRHMGQKMQDVITAMRERSADGFNINGPMFDFVRLAETAAIEGLPCWHGSEVDLGILEASALHAIAASSLCTIPADIFGEQVRQDDLITKGIVFENGKALIPQGNGLGVDLDQKALDKFKIDDIWEIKA
jgi:muconate cycloisomerase